MRRGTAAQLLAVTAQERVRLPSRREACGQLALGGGLHGEVGRGVGLFRAAVAEPQKNAQSVRVQGEKGMNPGEEEDLLGPGLSDRGEAPQRALRLLRRKPLEDAEVAAEFVERDAGAVE